MLATPTILGPQLTNLETSQLSAPIDVALVERLDRTISLTCSGGEAALFRLSLGLFDYLLILDCLNARRMLEI